MVCAFSLDRVLLKTPVYIQPQSYFTPPALHGVTESVRKQVIIYGRLNKNAIM